MEFDPGITNCLPECMIRSRIEPFPSPSCLTAVASWSRAQKAPPPPPAPPPDPCSRASSVVCPAVLYRLLFPVEPSSRLPCYGPPRRCSPWRHYLESLQQTLSKRVGEEIRTPADNQPAHFAAHIAQLQKPRSPSISRALPAHHAGRRPSK
ncbi:hypothetical protein PENSPDRAFT_351508 [Peniophora sp. CONT]|nr:hypothetical protein PENSPDRAFT_351508 [Peniophora sp. CONT]